jgi:hypothetical protein
MAVSQRLAWNRSATLSRRRPAVKQATQLALQLLGAAALDALFSDFVSIFFRCSSRSSRPSYARLFESFSVTFSNLLRSCFSSRQPAAQPTFQLSQEKIEQLRCRSAEPSMQREADESRKEQKSTGQAFRSPVRKNLTGTIPQQAICTLYIVQRALARRGDSADRRRRSAWGIG